MISIYTDGACPGNPGIGGWGVVILEPQKEPFYINGGEKDTTNNRMELQAAIKAMEYFDEKKEIEIFTDSKYLKDGIEKWINNWKVNGWKTANKKQVKNKDLWLMLEEKINKHKVSWNWVKGHAENKYNNKADDLARKYIEENF